MRRDLAGYLSIEYGTQPIELLELQRKQALYGLLCSVTYPQTPTKIKTVPMLFHQSLCISIVMTDRNNEDG